MPSVPRPTWAQPAAVARGPSPRPQASHKEDPVLAAKFSEIPALLIPPTPSSRGNMSSLRLHDSSYDSYEATNSASRPQYHFATSPGIPVPSQYNPLTVGQSPLKAKPVRNPLPTVRNNPHSFNGSIILTIARSPPHNNSDFSSAGGSPPPMANLQSPPVATSPSQNATDDEVIPTAIVIKNIPFNVKRETLLDIIASLAIPTPYAFNYHLDQQGSFRGLAFANFRQAADADAVVAALNGFDVQGRKLRVEYKKVLQAGEKERIEREKAIRRMRSMQIEKEQTGVTPLYDDARSLARPTSRSNTHPLTYPRCRTRNNIITSSRLLPRPPIQPSVTPSNSEKSSANELDLNDPSTLEIYSRILLFKDDRMRDELAFSRTLSPKQRRVVHLVAQKLGVYHYSVGEGRGAIRGRHAHRSCKGELIWDHHMRTPLIFFVASFQQQQRPPHTLSRAPSAYLAQAASQAPPTSLRVKKSMPDMKTLHNQAQRLNPRSSNGNMREVYAATISPGTARRQSSGHLSLFANGGAFGGGIPPLPNVPMQSTGSGHDSPGGVVRQPRGPGAGGFGRRDSRVGMSEGNTRGGLDARTYEPMEI
ncbi:R3h domain [Mycena venus]|uniref:R3h domain n=1 Tax=Mycena venus TaxID=2733690 RepID=A0A8H6XC50_9AGAR|nr:R3h domain [Mycena venus]